MKQDKMHLINKVFNNEDNFEVSIITRQFKLKTTEGLKYGQVL